MSIYLDRLAATMARKKEQQAPPPAPSGLGAAIEQLIDSAVEERVEAAMEKAKPMPNPAVPRHLRDFTDQPLSDQFPPPPPMAKPVRDLTVHLSRNEVGRVHKVSIGKTNFVALRDGEGRLIGMREED